MLCLSLAACPLTLPGQERQGFFTCFEYDALSTHGRYMRRAGCFIFGIGLPEQEPWEALLAVHDYGRTGCGSSGGECLFHVSDVGAIKAPIQRTEELTIASTIVRQPNMQLSGLSGLKQKSPASHRQPGFILLVQLRINYSRNIRRCSLCRLKNIKAQS